MHGGGRGRGGGGHSHIRLFGAGWDPQSKALPLLQAFSVPWIHGCAPGLGVGITRASFPSSRDHRTLGERAWKSFPIAHLPRSRSASSGRQSARVSGGPGCRHSHGKPLASWRLHAPCPWWAGGFTSRKQPGRASPWGLGGLAPNLPSAPGRTRCRMRGRALVQK